MDKELPVSAWPEWEIIEKIGEGSFAKVYKAKRTERGHSFYSAIKIITIPENKGELNGIRSEISDENSVREYFWNIVEECIQEITTMEYFRGNSHIVSVEDFKVVEYLDEIGWDIYIRMEYLTSFMDYCVGKELTESDVIRLGCDLCRSLMYCRQLNIIHRDIKPENIFVSRFGDFKLGDFGIARQSEHSMSSMSKKGTYSYMAPEMYRGESYDSSVDIYSLGIVLYKLMNQNRLPFLSLEKQLITYRDKEAALAKRIAGEKLPAPANASEDFAKIIGKACAYDSKERYHDPEEFLRDLETLARGEQLVEKDTDREPTLRVEKTTEDISGEKEHKEKNNKPRISVRKRRRIRNLIMMGVTGLVLAALCIGAGMRIRQILYEKQRMQNWESAVHALEENDSSTAQIDEFSMSISVIRDQVTEIVEKLPKCQEVGKAGESLRYYDSDGKLLKALIYPEMSDDGVYEEYYYWDERLFFAYIWTDEKEEKEELYYYDRRGKLIRWIDRDGTIHDKESDSTEYNKRGEKYWKRSLEQFD